jgi:aconitate hydratase
MSLDSFKTKISLEVGNKSYTIYSLAKLKEHFDIDSLPFATKILLENLLRHEDGRSVTKSGIEALCNLGGKGSQNDEIAFSPARILLQDLTGVPCVVDLAVMRDAVTSLGGSPEKVNPLIPVDLVIDHSVIAEYAGTKDAYDKNTEIEFERNAERYNFLRWGQQAFNNLRVVPPGNGICHQVNLEYLSRVVFTDEEGNAYPDTLVGTDSHTTMVNGLGILGWGVGGIEAEAAMLGQPIPMLIPEVIGLRLFGNLREGTTATDLVLSITELLRQHKVVGKMVECFGAGLQHLPVENRATIGNMSPEYGSTVTVFPIDEATLSFLRLTGRSDEQVRLVEAYAKEQGLWSNPDKEAAYSSVIDLDMSSVVPSLAGPSRPQDRISLFAAKENLHKVLEPAVSTENDSRDAQITLGNGEKATLQNGSVVICAITSCTNTSNPEVMIAAGLLAKKAVSLGLRQKPWVKTSLAPGSRVVSQYLSESALLPYLEKLGFDLVGFGCTTCIGNSGPLATEISEAINKNGLAVAAVLSGNRNFEGRIHPDVKLNYLASPPLIVTYALTGTMDINLETDPIGAAEDGSAIYLKDIWPTSEEINEVLRSVLDPSLFTKSYSDVFLGSQKWRNLDVALGLHFAWNEDSTYIHKPPFFDDMSPTESPLTDITGARVLAYLGDSVTTDHISPAGSIKPNSPAGTWLKERGVSVQDFNSYGTRRGNDLVMIRGTFANIRLKNKLTPGIEGGVTLHLPDETQTTIFDAAMAYKEAGTPLVIIAGKEYGTGSSRDWAAKGSALLGVKAVIAESFERIHRSNLIGMGVLPLQFVAPDNSESLGLTGKELYSILGLENIGATELIGKVLSVRADDKQFQVLARIDTPTEAEYYLHKGILRFVAKQLAKKQ